MFKSRKQLLNKTVYVISRTQFISRNLIYWVLALLDLEKCSCFDINLLPHNKIFKMHDSVLYIFIDRLFM